MNKDIKPKISIVVPVYKVEAYLPKCLNSLISQTYTNIEILLVDDGTPDNSGNICDEYAQKDKRIQVFHIVNKGVSYARNYAMKRATGDYICFVDSDDEVKESYVQHFVEALKKNVYIYISGINIIHMHKSDKPIIYPKNGVCGITDIFTKNELCRHGYAWAKCYNLKELRTWGVTFNQQIKFSEDLLFILECLKYTDKICYIPTADYQYYIRGNSASNKIYPLNTEIACYTEIKETILKISSIYHINLWNMKNIGEIMSMLFARIRNAMYHLPHISSQRRITIYNSLSNIEIDNIYHYRYINNIMVRIGYYFLKKHMYQITDIYFKFLYKFK